MTPAARLSACLEIVQVMAEKSMPLDHFIMGYFKQRRYAGSKDRVAILDMVYGVLRNQAKLDWWMTEHAKIELPESLDATHLLDQTRLRVFCYLILRIGLPISDIKQLFVADKFAPPPLSEAEITAFAALGQVRLQWQTGQYKLADLTHPDQPAHVIGEYPQWLEVVLQRSLGTDEAAANMRLMNGTSPVDLRVNALKAQNDDIKEEFMGLGLVAQQMSFAPNGLRLSQKSPLQAMPAFKKGLFEIQAESSQILAELCDVKPGEKVVDFCAGAGGKALAIAAKMNNKGRVYLLDVHTTRLKNAQKRIKRAGIDTAEIKVLSSERDVWVKRHKGQFDCVVIDAPCSGSGTWGRNPDAKWRFTPQNLQSLVDVQRRILESAQRLVKPGGRLFYATCSLLSEENEQQLDWFVQTIPGFSPLSLREISKRNLNQELTSETCDFEESVEISWMRLSPLKTKTDGFFISGFQRNMD